jgi:1,2-diacylglycerol 3-beta-glucosyltransferase
MVDDGLVPAGTPPRTPGLRRSGHDDSRMTISPALARSGGRPLSGVIGLLLAVGGVPVAVLDGYLALVTAAAATRRRSGRDDVTPRNPRARVAVLIPAHDEERAIGRTIDSVVGQDYPRSLVDVHVVADNCSDMTAATARQHGATVHERVDPDDPGKGPALRWLVRRVLATGPRPDAIVILDADTSFTPGVLRAVDRALDGGGVAWQTYYTVREPELSASVGLRHAALVLRHFVRPLGRTALGASSGLFGNGMVFRPTILEHREFSAHLTEDVEFQLGLLLDGDLVGFLPDAVVEAEMPETLASARTQNERWELGRLQLVKRYVPRLAREAVRTRVRHRAALVDASFDALVPPLSVLAAGTVVTGAAALVPGGSRTTVNLRRGIAAFSVVALGFHVFAGLRVGGVKRSVYAALFHAPRLVVWKTALWFRVMIQPGRVSWTRTERNDASGGRPDGAEGAPGTGR